MIPAVVASPNLCVARSSSPSNVPPPARTARAGGSTTIDLMSERSIISPSSQTALPATPCPPPLIETSTPCSRANSTAAITSSAPAQRAISAGRRSIIAFQTRRAAS